MARVTLTDARIRALKPALRGQRYELLDALVPGLVVRVTDRGRKTLMLKTRFPGSHHPTRRAIGVYGAVTLEGARRTAREWLELIQHGIDPRPEQERRRREERVKRDNTFGAVLEDYLRRHVKGKRKAAVVEREMRTNLMQAWRDRPVTEITRRDVVDLIEAIADRGAPYQAHNVFGHVRTFFNWAINRGVYGLAETSPCDRLKPVQLIGSRQARQRVLTDDELHAFWRAGERLGYPFGPLFQLLALTGQRKSEVGNARWREFDLDSGLWTIPPERFKSNATHLIPLSTDAVTLFDSLPRFRKGDYLFSTTFGETPLSGFSKAKARLDEIMQEELRVTLGDDVEFSPFVIHDLRRTVRTRLSSLRVLDIVAEMVLGHGRRGLARVYDQHKFVDEMREALDLWAVRLRSIVEPPPVNVVPLRVEVRK